MENLVTKSIIGGKDFESLEQIESVNPSTGEVIANIPVIGKDGIDRAISSAREALPAWSGLPVRERARYLNRIKNEILNDFEEIGALITKEQGKPINESLGTEIIPALDTIKHLARRGGKVLREENVNYRQPLFAHKKGRIIFEPKGVVVSITSWNFPFNIPFIDIASAILCGNTIVLKPSPETILIGIEIGDICRRAGLPDGVVNVIAVLDADAPYLTSHPGIDHISFTGSATIGRKVAEAAAANFTSVTLELSGKDPAIVAADADIERTARGLVWGAFWNAGQVCVSVERVYVDKQISEALTEAIVEETKKLRLGDPNSPDTDIGAMCTSRQVGIVEEHVKDAVEKGAVILTGGKRREPASNFFEPTVIIGVDHSMKIMKEETFGPVLPIMPVESLDEAISLASNSDLGLGASGWTTSKAVARKIQESIPAGQVLINDCAVTFGEPEAPWSGYKSSGVGRSHSKYGLLELVNIKYADYDPSLKGAQIWWFPYDGQLKRFYRNAFDTLYSSNLLRKFSAMARLFGIRRFYRRVSIPSLILRLKKLF